MCARSEHQGGDELTTGAQLGHHRETVFARQHDVKHQQIEIAGFRQKQLERGLTRVHHLGAVTLGLQIEAQAIGQVLFVFDHQDAAHLATGSCRMKVLPCPGPSLSAHARPPCRRATERTMNKPRPVPFTRVLSGPGVR